MPKLIGMFKLPFPRIRRGGPGGVPELIERVATDEDGQQWGLVMRRTALEPGVFRLTFERWIRFDAIPFAPNEVVTADSWTTTDDPTTELP